jgi:hypothetical protein
MRGCKFVIITLLAIVFAACQAANQTLSPTETMKALNEATKTKDVETVKKLISKGTLNLVEQSAKKQNTTVEELLKKNGGIPFQEFETRSEKIEGEKAIIEVKNNALNSWEAIPFVKEDGVWKVALDVFYENLKKNDEEEMNKSPAVAPLSNSKTETKKPESNSAANKK